jgi:long-chain acyl-CoA synthetase
MPGGPILNLIDMFLEARSRAKNKVFLTMDNEKVTFNEAYNRVMQLGAGLKALGVVKGDRVAMLLNNSPEFIYTYFAVLFLGAEIIPLNTFLRTEEVIYILNDSGAKLLVTSPDFSGVCRGAEFGTVGTLENIIALGPMDGVSHLLYKDVLKDTVFEPGHIDKQDVAAIIYTSGTTGHPKGAMLTHQNLVANVEQSIQAIKVRSSDRFIIFLPMFHAFSFTVCVLIPVYKRCGLSIIRSIQPFSRIIKAVFMERITIFIAIPQVYNVLAAKKIPRWLLWLNPVRLCISGAAPLAGDVLKRFEAKFRVPLMEGYGLSEASPVVSVNPFDSARKAGSVGPPLPGIDAKIVNDAGESMEAGEVGEIAIRGKNIMKGYFNRAEETSEVMSDGWLKTGDIGKIDGDGYLFIVDRKKDLIIVNGMNLYPREVEEILYSHPDVEDAVVVGKKDETHGEIPIGVVKLRTGAALDEKEIRRFCRTHLANFKVPNRFEFWDDIPRTGTGKILKREIKRMINEK